MKKKILVIDDEEHILELLKINLEFSGYDTYAYDTGKDVLEIIEKTNPDLILLDLMLPEIDGIEICKRIRRNPKFNKIKLLILSAKSDEIDKILCLEIGADDYITKPFSLRELLARIKAIFRRVDFEYDNTVEVMKKIDEKKENIKEEIIYYKDLKVDSPYNTYKNKGLPPAPICNPTVSSVEAAYHPADTEYLFFVTKGGGEHFFSKTYEEHLEFQKNK